MKRMSLLLICLATAFTLFAQPGYDIAITLKPYKNTYIYLGYYYGKMKALADSALLDGNSTGRFKGKELLSGGIYFVVSPKKEIIFEVLIDKQQHFSIIADTSNIPLSVKFTGSPDNKQFQEYSAFTSATGKKISEVTQQYNNAATKQDSVLLLTKSRKLGDVLQHFRDSISRKYPSSFLSALFKAMNEPKVPAASLHPGGKYDSNFAYRYYKDHYWDGISLTDERLVRTPFFEPKLEKYYDQLVVPNADSLIKETDAMLLQSRSSKEMYKYLMVHFVQKYVNPQYMGQDAVFVHIFEKYINTGKAEFFTPQYKEFAAKRAYSLMANLIGQPAPDLVMVDTANKPRPLSKISAAFTVICFWDPTCSHCKEVVPKVDSIFKAKWLQEGVEIYGVKVDGTRDEWTKFIQEHHLEGWNNVYQLPAQQEADVAAGKPGYKQLYDVYQTPLLYLLDKDKRIIAKKLTYLQIDEVINLKLQSPKSK
ncbi:MAG: thioredoxin-like domain-containing protein [Flavitalea sp.]